MEYLQKLRAKRAKAIEQTRSILDTAKEEKRNLSEDEEKRYQAFLQDSRDLAKSIERELELQALEDDLDQPAPEHRNRVNDFEGAAPPDNEDDDDDDVDQRSSSFKRKKSKISGVKEPTFRSAGDFYRSVILSSHTANGHKEGVRRLFGYHDECRASGLSTEMPSEGGFLIPPEIAQGIISETLTTGEILSRVNVLPSSSSHLILNGVDEKSRSSSRFGGIVSYWTKEAEEIEKSKPKFRQIDLKVNKIAAAVYLTEEQIEDSVALESWIESAVPEELEYRAEEAIFEGSGAGQPLGIVKSGCTVSVAKEGSQAAGTILFENIVKMWSRLNARSQMTAAWFVNQDTIPQLAQMRMTIGSAGVPVFLPPNGASDKPYSTLLGRPVIPVEHCESVDAKGDICLYDLASYLWMVRGAVRKASSLHVRFLYDESVLKFTWRVDGQPMWSAPRTPKKGSNTVSPFVVLDART